MCRQTQDSWLKRRIMRLTVFEKWAVNRSKNAEKTVSVGEELLSHASLPDRPRSLELGCGQGALARLMVEHYHAQMIATDFDLAQIELAEARLRDLGDRVTLRCVDARDLPFEDGEFDVVFSFGVMHHIASEWRQVVREVSRVLTPTGRFIFTDFYLPRGFLRIFGKLCPHYDQLAYEPLKEVLREQGFEITYQTWERHMAGFLAYGKTIASKI